MMGLEVLDAVPETCGYITYRATYWQPAECCGEECEPGNTLCNYHLQEPDYDRED